MDLREGRPDELDRLDSISEAIASLTSVLDAAEPLDAALDQVARLAADAIPDADAVSISVLDDPAPRTAAFTTEESLLLDRAQYGSGYGPCLEAAETQRPVRLRIDILEPDRYPDFHAAADAAGINATLSVPLIVEQVGRQPELVGSLNIYSHTASAFDPFDESLVRLYTTTAGQAITQARRWQALRAEVDQLSRALLSRSDIDQAKGALRAIHGYSEDEAFQHMVTQSQHRNVKVHALAREFLQSLRSTGTAG